MDIRNQESLTLEAVTAIVAPPLASGWKLVELDMGGDSR